MKFWLATQDVQLAGRRPRELVLAGTATFKNARMRPQALNGGHVRPKHEAARSPSPTELPRNHTRLSHHFGLTRHSMHFLANDLVRDLVKIDRQRIGDLGELRP